MRNRNHEFASQQHLKQLHRRAARTEAVEFFNVLTGAQLLAINEAHLPQHRERLYPPTVVLSMFLRQVLNADRSCQKAVNGWAAQRAAEGLSVRSVATGGYCRARQRLPTEMVQALTRESGQLLSDRAGAGWRWRGRAVKLVDGTGISMPDTPANQSSYPQPHSQAEGVGFPLARLVAVMCLSSGALLDARVGPFEAKGGSERDLLRQMLGNFRAGDVVLADAYYCSYFLIATLQQLGVDVLFEQHGARKTDFRLRLGVRDHQVRWPKSPNRPHWMTPEQYRAFPDEITVRETRVHGRVLVRTLLDSQQIPKVQLSSLYAQRWQVELDFRNLKTTLGMQVLSCLSAPMVQKELWVYLLAYNLIRLLMAQAAQQAGLQPRQLSFKHTVQLWLEWGCRGLSAHPDRWHVNLFALIAQARVGDRPDRIEPRVRKRRSKTYPWLQVPRAQARQQLRKHRASLEA